MKPCIYGDQTYPEGATVCVNGRELLCVAGEWTETGHACTDATSQPAAEDRPPAPPASDTDRPA
ncbi:MAG: YnjH family protein [Hydrogenophaga sp.]|uniref:DUF1496 domain-containing protein n=1 Tax=Hydrogenophaga sp. TaxID=1904254 RepID=UPI0026228DBE|nr:DUF1496 domain-containing protein [Hydrogenophaga sp.]MCV0441191.1 YnjH family protein [Hydrogenophaga sp.]